MARDLPDDVAAVTRPSVDLAPRPDVPDIPFVAPAVPSVARALPTPPRKQPHVARLTDDGVPPEAVAKPDRQEAVVSPAPRALPTPPKKEPHVARLDDVPEPPNTVVQPQKQASAGPQALPEAATHPDLTKPARPHSDMAPRPDVPDTPFAAPARPSTSPPKESQSLVTRLIEKAEPPTPNARSQDQHASVEPAVPSNASASPELRPEPKVSPKPDVPDVKLAQPEAKPARPEAVANRKADEPAAPKTVVEPEKQARLVPPKEAARDLPANIASGTTAQRPDTPDIPLTAPAVPAVPRTIPAPQTKQPSIPLQAGETVTSARKEPLGKVARLEPKPRLPDFMEPVLPRDRRPERLSIDTAPRPDMPDTVFILPEVVAKNDEALNSIALSRSMMQRARVTADAKRRIVSTLSIEQIAGEMRNDGEVALDAPTTGSVGAGPQAAVTATVPDDPTLSPCDKARSALAGDDFSELEAKSCKGIVYSFLGKRSGRTFSIKYGPLTGEYIAIEQASNGGMSVEVLRGKVEKAPKVE